MNVAGIAFLVGGAGVLFALFSIAAYCASVPPPPPRQNERPRVRIVTDRRPFDWERD